MKPIYVLLIALVTGLIGAVLGITLGGSLGGTIGIASGSTYGICVATETAREEGLLTQEQTTQLREQIRARAGEDFQLSPEDQESLADNINCSEVLQEIEQPSQ